MKLEKHYTAKQIKELLGIDEKSVYRMVRMGLVKSFRPLGRGKKGRKVLIAESELQSLIDQFTSRA
jgi:hypothetical protein